MREQKMKTTKRRLRNGGRQGEKVQTSLEFQKKVTEHKREIVFDETVAKKTQIICKEVTIILTSDFLTHGC